MYHPESDSLFEIDKSEWPDIAETIDGQLCTEVTGIPEWEDRFKQLNSGT